MANINDVKVRLVADSTIRGKKFKKDTTLVVKDIIGDEGYWDIEKKGKTVATAIKHYKVQELAKLAGVNVIREEILSLPTLDNRMHTMWKFEVDMELEGGNRSPVVIEIGVGTADDWAGSEYMARKRAFDRAVLDLLGLYDVYSDIEADQFGDQSDRPTKLEDLPVKERNVLAEIIKRINQSKTVAEIDEVGKALKVELPTMDVSEQATGVIRSMWKAKKAKLESIEKLTDEEIL